MQINITASTETIVSTNHAQFAVKQVAQKEKHWQPTACDGSKHCKSASNAMRRFFRLVYARLASALRSVRGVQEHS